MRAALGAILWLGVGSSAAHAVTPFDLYVQGKYDQAIEAGLHQNDAPGLALAARAELAADIMREEPCLDCLERAENYASRAVAADPKLAEGHIYLAVSLGYEARIIGPISARFKGFPKTAKDEIDEALAVDPRNGWAWAALGGWNFEIVRNGGKALASWLYDASLEQGLADFQKSFALDPANFVLRYQYALTLSAYDRNRFRDEISGALTRAVAAKPRTAYETFAQARARTLLAALNAGDTTTFDRLVRRAQGYPPRAPAARR
jgi:tetratricopeptide (TPR) repeat protein